MRAGVGCHGFQFCGVSRSPSSFSSTLFILLLPSSKPSSGSSRFSGWQLFSRRFVSWPARRSTWRSAFPTPRRFSLGSAAAGVVFPRAPGVTSAAGSAAGSLASGPSPSIIDCFFGHFLGVGGGGSVEGPGGVGSGVRGKDGHVGANFLLLLFGFFSSPISGSIPGAPFEQCGHSNQGRTVPGRPG